MKKSNPRNFIKVLKGETEIVPERRVTFNINDKVQFLNESNTTISPDKLKIKIIQGIFRQKIFKFRNIFFLERFLHVNIEEKV